MRYFVRCLQFTLIMAAVVALVQPAEAQINRARVPIACASTPGPGNTAGPVRQLCADGNGGLFVCNNASGCTVAADWSTAGGSGGSAIIGTYTVGAPYVSITAAYNACAAVIGSGYGSCDIWDYKLPETLNALPWIADHTEKITVHLHLGPGVLTICDVSLSPEGNSCAAAFSLATGNGGSIEGTGQSLSQGDTGTIIRAGSLETAANWPNGTVDTATGTKIVTFDTGVNLAGFPLKGWFNNRIKINGVYYTISSVTDANHLVLKTDPGNQTGHSFTVGFPGVLVQWGDTCNTDMQDSFGALIYNLTVDLSCNVGSLGVMNSTAQEESAIDEVGIRNFDTIGFWMSSIRSSNSWVGKLNVIPNNAGFSCLTASTIPVLIANTGSPRQTGGYTINGLNGTTYNANGATFTHTTGVISGLTGVNTALIAANLGPNGSPTYVYINNVSADWNGPWIVTASTSTSITVTASKATTDPTGGATSTVQIIPTYGLVAVGGTAAANYYAPDTSSGGQALEMSGVHFQHVGVGLQVDASSAEALKASDVSGSSDVNTVVNTANSSSLRDITIENMNGAGSLNTIVDNVNAVTKTNQYWGHYSLGTQPGGTAGGAFWEFAHPVSMIEVALTGNNVTTHCISTRDVFWADSTAHRLKVCDNGGTAAQLVQSGVDIGTSDQVLAVNGTTVNTNSAAGQVINTTASAVSSWTATPTLGVAGTTAGTLTLTNSAAGEGSLIMTGHTSGTVTVKAQAAAGTPAILWPNTSGTVATTGTAPVTVSATTGAVGCATCVATGQANTYSTGDQNFTSATHLELPSSGGAAPTVMGDHQYDSTQSTLKLGEQTAGPTNFTTAGVRVLCFTGSPGGNGAANNMLSSDGGTYNTLTSTQATSAQQFNTTCSIPANVLIANKRLRVSIGFLMTSTATIPTQQLTLKLGSTAVAQTTTVANGAAETNRSGTMIWYIDGTAAVGASVVVEASCASTFGVTGAALCANTIVGGNSFATNGALTLAIFDIFSSSAAGNMTQLRSLLVELIN